MRKQVKITINELEKLFEDRYGIEGAIENFRMKSLALFTSRHFPENGACIFCGADTFEEGCPGYTLENLIKTEARRLGHTFEDVLSKSRKKKHIRLRRYIVKAAIEDGWKLTQIASAMNLDHSTVWYILHRQKDF